MEGHIITKSIVIGPFNYAKLIGYLKFYWMPFEKMGEGGF
jgi:hypothetical protein